MSNKKFETEKALHEIIRDLPNAKTLDSCFRRGLIPLDEALNAIADEIKKEKGIRNNNYMLMEIVSHMVKLEGPAFEVYICEILQEWCKAHDKDIVECIHDICGIYSL